MKLVRPDPLALPDPLVLPVRPGGDQLSCGASCEENDQIINAYALNPGGVIAFVDERNVTFRPNKRPAVLVLVCIGR